MDFKDIPAIRGMDKDDELKENGSINVNVLVKKIALSWLTGLESLDNIKNASHGSELEMENEKWWSCFWKTQLLII